jgi:hypothetical protein
VSARPYSLEAWRAFQDQREPLPNAPSPAIVPDIPTDASMDEGVVLGCWNGERFVSWETWRTSTPVEREAHVPSERVGASARCVTALCGCTQVWLVRDGGRWFMFEGSHRPESRRRDFASPFLVHAQRTAEAWYGFSAAGFHEELERDDTTVLP